MVLYACHVMVFEESSLQRQAAHSIVSASNLSLLPQAHSTSKLADGGFFASTFILGCFVICFDVILKFWGCANGKT